MIPEIISENQMHLNFLISNLKKHKIAYHITGGLAGNIYGFKWRLHDIDIEVSQKDINRVASLFKQNIICPLARFIDNEFDIMLLTLRVNDVEIEINQAEDAFIFTADGRRVKLDTDLSKAIENNFFGISICVQPLEDIIHYKELLVRNEDIKDLKALKAHMQTSID